MRLDGLMLHLFMCGCASARGVQAAPDVGGPQPVEAVSTAPIERAAEPREPACSLSWDGRPLGASVLTIPAESASAMMAPVLVALCACTRPGHRYSIVVDFEPERGRAAAHDDDGDVALDRCLEPRLGDGSYPAFELGSDCIDCGPKRYGVFGGPPPAPPPGSRIRMPLEIDRTKER